MNEALVTKEEAKPDTVILVSVGCLLAMSWQAQKLFAFRINNSHFGS
jgi:hypothetical protein